MGTDRDPSCVLWTSILYPYGVEVLHAPMSEQVVGGEEGPESWDVSKSAHWRGKIGSPVADVQTFWERLAIGSGYVRGARVAEPREIDVPVALRIDFAARRLARSPDRHSSTRNLTR